MLRNNVATLQLMELMKHAFSPKEAMAFVVNGGNPNVKIAGGLTLLHKLIIEDSDECINDQYILDLVENYGANVSLTDDLGLTPLAHLISRNCFLLETAMKLIEYGADPNTLAADGKSLLHILIRKNGSNIQQAIKNLICIYHADIEIRDDRGDTSIEYLLKKQNYRLAMELISLGGNPITKKRIKPSLIEVLVKNKNESACLDLQTSMVNYGFLKREKINQYRTNFLNFLFVLAQSLENKTNGYFGKLPLEIIFSIIGHFNFSGINTTRQSGLKLAATVLEEYKNIKVMLKKPGGVNVIQYSTLECKFFKSVQVLQIDYDKLKKQQKVSSLFPKLFSKNNKLKKFIENNALECWYDHSSIFKKPAQRYTLLRQIQQTELFKELKLCENEKQGKLRH